MMLVAEVNDGPQIERRVGLPENFHGSPMVDLHAQQNTFGNLRLRHQTAIAPIPVPHSWIDSVASPSVKRPGPKRFL